MFKILPATIVRRANVETKGSPPVSIEADLERRDDSPDISSDHIQRQKANLVNLTLRSNQKRYNSSLIILDSKYNIITSAKST